MMILNMAEAALEYLAHDFRVSVISVVEDRNIEFRKSVALLALMENPSKDSVSVHFPTLMSK